MPTSEAPSVTITAKGVEYHLVFDLQKLISIEDAYGKGCFELMTDEFGSIMEAAQAGSSPAAAARSIRLKSMARFVGVAMGLDAAAVPAAVGTEQLMQVFLQLFSAFTSALGQLSGAPAAGEEEPKHPRSGGSETGPGSSSASEPPSSVPSVLGH